jgi:allene oxide cyclase
MRKAAILTTLLAATFSAATSAPTSAQAATLKLVERATGNATHVHGGSAPDNVGDILTFSNPVYDETNSKKLGLDQGYCVRLVVGVAYECHWTLSIAAGQLSVDGPFLDAGDSTLAVTGGTGAFSTARGQMHLHARDAKGSAYDYIYELK